MNPSSYPRSIAFVLLLGSVALISGCAGMNEGLPDSVVNPQVQGPAMSGTVYGGHAPITGAHVYLLQPGTGGIGSQATSLLGSGTTTSPGGYPLQTNPATGGDPNIPSGWKYVISDNQGGFSFTGGYTCSSGQPVYVYAYEGNPSTVNNTAIVQLAVLGDCPTDTNGPFNFGTSSTNPISYVYLNEVSTVAAAYVFQPYASPTGNTAVDIGSSGTSAGLMGIENAALTAAQLYDIEGSQICQVSAGPPAVTCPADGEGHIANYETQLDGVPNNGNGIVPQATLDSLANIIASCVDGATGASSASCTTLFTNATDNGLTGGTKPTDTATAAINIARYPAGNHASTTGVNTAFVKNIYDLQTATVPYTPNLTKQPNDFTVVISYPENAVDPQYGGVINPFVGLAESIQIDQKGELWITAQTHDNIIRWSPLGSQDSQHVGTYIYGYVSIDGNNNAWTGSANSTTGIEKFGSNGVLTTTYGSGYLQAYTVITDQTGNAYFFAQDATAGDYDTYNNSEMWEYSPTGTLESSSPKCDGHTAAFVYNCISQPTADGTSIFNTGDFVAHGAIESASQTTLAKGHLWLTSENSPYQIARVSPAGVADFVYTTNTGQPEFPSIDRNGNAWIASQSVPSVIYKITPTATTPFYTVDTLTSASTNATLTMTFGSAVDGNNNVWFANRCDLDSGTPNDCKLPLAHAGSNSIVVINGTNNLAISPPTNYVPETEYPSTPTTLTPILGDSLNIAIDPSGNVWVTNYYGNPTAGSSIAEIVGAAAPVVTPLSVAAGTNRLGQPPL